MNSISLADLNIRPGATGQVYTTCPLCSHTRKKAKDPCFSVNLDEGIYHCHNCDVEGKLDTGAIKYRSAPSQKNPDKKWKRDYFISVLSHSIRDHNRLREYLNYRGCPVKEIPTDLLFHPYLEYKKGKELLGKFPTMIGVVRSLNGKVMGLHRTYLNPKGFGKADLTPCKKAFSYKTIKGGAIQLYPATDTLALTEGIETALAVYGSTGLPVWACLGTSGIKSVEIPETVSRVLIMADHDRVDPLRGYRPGEQAAQVLAKRLIGEGRKVKIVIPPGEGTDWLDVLNSTKARKVA